MPARGHGGGHGMESQAQWRYLMSRFGNRGWVHRWAEKIEASRGKKVGYHSLPVRKGARKRA